MGLAGCEATHGKVGRGNITSPSGFSKCELFWYIFHLLTRSIPKVIYSLFPSIFCLSRLKISFLSDAFSLPLPFSHTLSVSFSGHSLEHHKCVASGSSLPKLPSPHFFILLFSSKSLSLGHQSPGALINPKAQFNTSAGKLKTLPTRPFCFLMLSVKQFNSRCNMKSSIDLRRHSLYHLY